jgi:hypothetical protein
MSVLITASVSRRDTSACSRLALSFRPPAFSTSSRRVMPSRHCGVTGSYTSPVMYTCGRCCSSQRANTCSMSRVCRGTGGWLPSMVPASGTVIENRSPLGLVRSITALSVIASGHRPPAIATRSATVWPSRNS